MGTLVEVGLWNAAAATVLALAAAAASRLFRRPALTHTLWVLVLLKLVTPPLVPFSLPWPEEEPAPPVEERLIPAEGPAAPAPVDGDALPAEGEEGAAELREPDPLPPSAPAVPWRRWAAAAWLGGAVLWAAWAALHVARFRRVLRLACLAPGHLQDEAEALARRMGLRRCPPVWLVPGSVSPMVWALGRSPCLLFPSGLLERLDGDGRAALLAHELAHVRRRDHWVRLLELAATGLYWWHPVLWWARRELHEAEEQCCDAWGVWAVGGDGRPYALALLQAVAFVSQARLPLPAGASGVGQVSHLKRRLAMVMQGKTSRSLSWAGLGVVLGLGLLLVPLFPARGQAPPPPAPVPEKKDVRDQQIEALKKVIELLEEEKRQEPPTRKDVRLKLLRDAGALPGTEAPPGDAKAADLQKQLKKLDDMIAVKRKELEDLEAKARDLRAVLKKLGDRSPVPDTRPPGGRPTAGRVEDLEKKLDQLQKDLEELRRELKREKPSGPPGRTAPPTDTKGR